MFDRGPGVSLLRVVYIERAVDFFVRNVIIDDLDSTASDSDTSECFRLSVCEARVPSRTRVGVSCVRLADNSISADCSVSCPKNVKFMSRVHRKNNHLSLSVDQNSPG